MVATITGPTAATTASPTAITQLGNGMKETKMMMAASYAAKREEGMAMVKLKQGRGGLVHRRKKMNGNNGPHWFIYNQVKFIMIIIIKFQNYYHHNFLTNI